MRSKTWLARSSDNNMQSLVIVRSPYRNNVKKKVAAITKGFGCLNWTIYKLSEEKEEALLKKFEIGELYQTDKNA